MWIDIVAGESVYDHDMIKCACFCLPVMLGGAVGMYKHINTYVCMDIVAVNQCMNRHY